MKHYAIRISRVLPIPLQYAASPNEARLNLEWRAKRVANLNRYIVPYTGDNDWGPRIVWDISDTPYIFTEKELHEMTSHLIRNQLDIYEFQVLEVTPTVVVKTLKR